jgi:hypothetical protein
MLDAHILASAVLLICGYTILDALRWRTGRDETQALGCIRCFVRRILGSVPPDASEGCFDVRVLRINDR